MTKQTNWNGKEVLLVEVPEDCIKPVIIGRRDVDNLADEEWMPFETLPEGDWQFAFASPLSPTEEEAREWVGFMELAGLIGYLDYSYENDYRFPLMSPIESLHSRIRSEGFEHTERVVILIK